MQTRALRSLKVTFPEIRAVVAENNKQRFSLIPITAAPPATSASSTELPPNPPTDDAATVSVTGASSGAQDFDENDPADYLIRANQGHSIAVAADGLLEPITAETTKLPEMVVHGTTHAAWPLILKSGGLKRMTRNHVHFATGLPAGLRTMDNGGVKEDEAEAKREPVMSGMRNSSSILIYIDLPKALAAGLKFWRSENGVVLSEGDENGLIRTEFFKRAEERKRGLGVLVRDGEIVQELPAELAAAGPRHGGGSKGGKKPPKSRRDRDEAGVNGREAGVKDSGSDL